GSAGGTMTFDAQVENQRPALTLANGLVYIAFASYCDTGDYHGWVLAHDKTTLEQKKAYNTTPNAYQEGVWMSGEGLSVDDAGNLYVVTGNGSFDADEGGTSLGTSVIKLSKDLDPLDWFTPYNYDALNGGDLDLGSAGALLVPGTDLLVTGGKGGF